MKYLIVGDEDELILDEDSVKDFLKVFVGDIHIYQFNFKQSPKRLFKYNEYLVDRFDNKVLYYGG